MIRQLLLATLLVVAARDGLRAQELRGVVVDSATRRPIAGAVLVVLDATGSTLARNITNERGVYRVALPERAHQVRALRIGYRLRDMPLPDRTGDITELTVAMIAIPSLLEPMTVSAAASCPRRSDVAAAYSLLEQARAGLLATIVAREARPATLKVLIYERVMDGNSDRVDHQKVQIDSSVARTTSFSAAATASRFVERGFAEDSANTRMYYGPDAEVLLDDKFLVGYCIRVEDPERERPNQVGLGFSAADRRRGRIDIEGALWIDTVAKALRDFDFRFIGVERGRGAPIPGGRIWFREMENGVVLIDRWYFRLIGATTDTVYGRNNVLQPRQSFFTRFAGGELARAIWPDGLAWKGPLGIVQVHVVDEKGKPATGLVVRLGDSDYLASPDAHGDLEIPDVLPGPYPVMVIDSVLASAGVTLGTPLTVFALRDSVAKATLVAPPPSEFQRKACSMTGSRAWVLVHVERNGVPVNEALWDIGRSLGSPNEFVVASGITGKDGTFGFCDRYTPDRVFDLRARDSAEPRRPVILTVSGMHRDLTIELPPRVAP
ncbi:MAG: carboxypeptidase-like regulatory domain-containing protein [bacterium]